MKLYSFWRSSCAWRVRIALALKNIEVDTTEVNLFDDRTQEQPQLDMVSQLRQVPVLAWEHDGDARSLTQSVAIIEYLNDVYPDPPLLPAEPYLRARARMLAEIVNAGIQPMQNASLMRRLEQRGVDADELARDHIARGLAALENACQPTAQGYLVGESISTADIFLIPQLYVARRFHLDLSATPTLLSVEDRCAEHPAFVRAHADAQPGAPS